MTLKEMHGQNREMLDDLLGARSECFSVRELMGLMELAKRFGELTSIIEPLGMEPGFVPLLNIAAVPMYTDKERAIAEYLIALRNKVPR